MSQKIKNALISLSDKSKIERVLKVLQKYKINIISSGGTCGEIKKLGYKCTEISKYTKFSEMLDGRVKTLHPKVHGGILAKRKDQSHQDDLQKAKINNIDLVIVNLYPFKETIKDPNVSWENAIENIDIGGPSLVRAAAKNHKFTTVIVDPLD